MNVVVKYKGEFPSLTENTVDGLLKKYRSQLEANVLNSKIVVSAMRGRPLCLSEELDKKLRAFLTHMRMAGGTINHHVVFGVLIGLIDSDLTIYSIYLEFQIADGWIQSLYRRMKLARRMVTISRPTIMRPIWLEVLTQYLRTFPPSQLSMLIKHRRSMF